MTHEHRRPTPRPRGLLVASAAWLALASLVGLACSSGSSDDSTDTSETSGTEPDGAAEPSDSQPEEPQGESSSTYADDSTWLCRPDIPGDACDLDLDATIVRPDGSTEPDPWEAAADPAVDCFYVYPTISTDEGQNSDLMADPAEIGIAANQAARFGEVCDVYAPMYRQIPLGALFDNLSGRSAGDTTTTASPGESPRDIAYGDVRESFMHYLAEYNDGRPYVLIGHSQGAGHLGRLISEEIDGDEVLRSQLLSAMLIGGAVAASGEDAYEEVGQCTSTTDTGCVVSYASFYAGEPPPEDSLFGHLRSAEEGRAICTNPVDPATPGPAPMQSYFRAGHTNGAPEVATPFIRYDGVLTGECRSDDSFDWLEVAVAEGVVPSVPQDFGGRITPQWGAHLSDVNFAQGDLIELVRTQASTL